MRTSIHMNYADALQYGYAFWGLEPFLVGECVATKGELAYLKAYWEAEAEYASWDMGAFKHPRN